MRLSSFLPAAPSAAHTGVKAIALLLAVAAACVPAGPRLPTEGPAPDRRRDPDACIVGDRSARLRDTVTVALADPVALTGRGWPQSAAERFVHAHQHRTLVRVDCEGRVRPGLAASWKRDAGTLWTVTLRDDASFADGSPLTAADVRASWQRLPAWALPATVRSAEGRTLVIQLPLETDDAIAVLAHPALAPVREGSSAASPIGAGSHRVSGVVSPVRTLLVPGKGVAAIDAPAIRVRQIAAADARDQIDRGVDALITDDPAAIAYARSKSDYAIDSLPWSLTYSLLVPGRTGPATSDEGEWVSTLRARVARDAVRGAARPATGPFWWSSTSYCESIPAGAAQNLARPARRQPRIGYDAADATARAIAERLVALSGFIEGSTERAALAKAFPDLTGSTRLTALPLGAAELERALGAGTIAAAVVALPNRSLAPCLELVAPGLGGLTVAASALDPRLVVPLVDVRPTLIRRRDSFAGTAGLFGTVLVRGAEIPPR